MVRNRYWKRRKKEIVRQYTIFAGQEFNRFLAAIDKDGILISSIAAYQVSQVSYYCDVYGTAFEEAGVFNALIHELHTYAYNLILQHLMTNHPIIAIELHNQLIKNLNIHVIEAKDLSISVVNDLFPNARSDKHDAWTLVRDSTELHVNKYH